MPVGVDGSYSRGKEGINCGGGRPSRIGAVMAGFAFGLQNARDEARSAAGYGRWRVGILESIVPDLVNETDATVLGSQDGQRVRQAAQESTRCGQEDAAQHLPGRDPSQSGEGV